MTGKYILKGHEVERCEDLLTGAKWFEKADRIVAKTEQGEVWVSTVFLGLDHNYCEGAPLLFETMVFGGDKDQYQERYSTWEEAEIGHKRIAKEVLV